MWGGTNFQYEFVRHMNQLCMEADPAVPIKPSEDSSSSMFESSAEAPDRPQDISSFWSEFLIHKNNEVILGYCCFLPLSCRGNL